MEGREGGREQVKKGLGEVRRMRRGEEREPGMFPYLFWHLAQSGVQTAVSATSARYWHEI